MSFVVTGASGFIGRRVCVCLANSLPDAAITGISRGAGSLSRVDAPNCELVSSDLLDRELLRRLPGRADVVMHLAGDGRSFVRPDEQTAQTVANVLMTARVADYAASARAALVVFASSVYVYSGCGSVPFREDVIDVPAENLGATKLGAEGLLKTRAFAGQFRAVALRIFTTYGPGSKPHQFIPQTIAKLQSAEPTARFGNPEAKRDFVFVDDVARAFVASAALRDRDVAFEALNVGSGVATRVGEVISIVADLLDAHKRIDFAPASHGSGGANGDHLADVSKIRSLLGWRAEISLREGLRRTVDAFSAADGIAGDRGGRGG